MIEIKGRKEKSRKTEKSSKLDELIRLMLVEIKGHSQYDVFRFLFFLNAMTYSVFVGRETVAYMTLNWTYATLLVEMAMAKYTALEPVVFSAF